MDQLTLGNSEPRLGRWAEQLGPLGQAGPGPQGLLVLLELTPKARVGLGHGAGALHGLQTGLG